MSIRCLSNVSKWLAIVQNIHEPALRTIWGRTYTTCCKHTLCYVIPLFLFFSFLLSSPLTYNSLVNCTLPTDSQRRCAAILVVIASNDLTRYFMCAFVSFVMISWIQRVDRVLLSLWYRPSTDQATGPASRLTTTRRTLCLHFIRRQVRRVRRHLRLRRHLPSWRQPRRQEDYIISLRCVAESLVLSLSGYLHTLQ